MPLEATNDFVFVTRDKAESEKSGLVIPNQGREKPHRGTIVSIGELVEDKKIKRGKGRKCLFHKTTGFEIDVDGVVYVVLTGRQILGVL